MIVADTNVNAVGLSEMFSAVMAFPSVWVVHA